METIIKILMERDGESRESATARVEDAKSELLDAMDGTSCLSIEDVMYGELGLEVDYALDLMF